MIRKTSQEAQFGQCFAREFSHAKVALLPESRRDRYKAYELNKTNITFILVNLETFLSVIGCYKLMINLSYGKIILPFIVFPCFLVRVLFHRAMIHILSFKVFTNDVNQFMPCYSKTGGWKVCYSRVFFSYLTIKSYHLLSSSSAIIALP